ncbi:MAG TPA: hypothetical protein VFV28_04650 [Limnobacter sp.]|nr:hypothetical protein [Limnobacter sp.]
MKQKAELRVSVDRVLADQVRHAATELNMPVSALVRAQIQGFLQAREKSEQLGNPNFRVVAEFSLGIRSAGSAMHALSLERYSQLLDLLTAAGLPVPSLPEARLDQMVRELKTLSEL